MTYSLDRCRKLAVALAASLLWIVSQGVSADDITIGWTSYPADIPVIADAIEGGKDEAERLGVNVEFALSAGAVAQANAVDNLLALEVDILAINPEDSRAIGPSVVKANEAGVPVVMFIGDNLGDGETVSLISSDEELGGYTIAKWGFEKLGGKGRIALIQGTKAHQAGLLRENGFQRAMEEYPDIEMVAYGEANWMRDRANTLAADMLTRDAEMDFIFALSDAMAKGRLLGDEARRSDADDHRLQRRLRDAQQRVAGPNHGHAVPGLARHRRPGRPHHQRSRQGHGGGQGHHHADLRPGPRRHGADLGRFVRRSHAGSRGRRGTGDRRLRLSRTDRSRTGGRPTDDPRSILPASGNHMDSSTLAAFTAASTPSCQTSGRLGRSASAAGDR